MPPETEGGLLPSPDTLGDNMRLDPKCRAVCFDMDGTLLDTKVDYKGISDTVFHALEGSDYPRELIDYTKTYKNNVDRWFVWMQEHGRTEEAKRMAAAISDRISGIEMERVGEAVPFPGVPEMLRALRAKGYKTGVLTRGNRDYAETALRISGVIDLIDGMVARDDYPESESKPAPISMVHMAETIGVHPEEITYVGDHKYDWLSSVGVSAKFVAVKTGTYSEADWRALDPNITVIDSAADIIGFI